MSFGRNIDGTYWFISYLYYWYIIFYFGAIANEKTQKIFLEIELQTAKKDSLYVYFKQNCILFLIVIFAIPILNWLCENNAWTKGSGAVLYLYEFPIGILLYLFSYLQVRKEIKEGIWAALLFISIVYICQNYVRVNDSNYTAFTMSQAVLWLSITQLNPIPCSSLLVFLGKYSYSIYLFEGFFLTRAYQWLDMISTNEIKHLLFFMISIIFGYIFQTCIFSLFQKKNK